MGLISPPIITSAVSKRPPMASGLVSIRCPRNPSVLAGKATPHSRPGGSSLHQSQLRLRQHGKQGSIWSPSLGSGGPSDTTPSPRRYDGVCRRGRLSDQVWQPGWLPGMPPELHRRQLGVVDYRVPERRTHPSSKCQVRWALHVHTRPEPHP
jgi:hypothetical protein